MNLEGFTFGIWWPLLYTASERRLTQVGKSIRGMDLIRENDLLPLLQEASEARFTDREWN